HPGIGPAEAERPPAPVGSGAENGADTGGLQRPDRRRQQRRRDLRRVHADQQRRAPHIVERSSKPRGLPPAPLRDDAEGGGHRVAGSPSTASPGRTAGPAETAASGSSSLAAARRAAPAGVGGGERRGLGPPATGPLGKDTRAGPT